MKSKHLLRHLCLASCLAGPLVAQPCLAAQTEKLKKMEIPDGVDRVVVLGKGAELALPRPEAEKEIRALEKVQARAWLARDQAALERLWSPEFVINAPSNQVLTREGVFREMRTPRLELVSLERTVERVTPFGDIVISIGVDHYISKHGPAAGVVRTQRYTNVWRREGDTWRMIARHAHLLPLDPAQPPASSKPSK